MFEEFSKKKVNEYISQLKFVNGTISFHAIKDSTLPPYIINFIDCSANDKTGIYFREDISGLLSKAVIFNINYVIKPKASLLKFLFGNVETRPVDYIKTRLQYFQFYNYYIDPINEFININSPLVLSADQVEAIIDGVNKNMLKEIADDNTTDRQIMNLIKLLYYFFLSLTENNPVNIKLPKRILSAFFKDKGFDEIKKKIDSFFQDEIFIQEAANLIRSNSKSSIIADNEAAHEDTGVNEAIRNARSEYLNTEQTGREITKAGRREIILEDEEQPSANSSNENAGEVKSEEIKTAADQTDIPDSEIYSEELLNYSELAENEKKELSPEEKRKNLIDYLFCEEKPRKKIVKKLFKNDELRFKNFVNKILDISTWSTASDFIDDYYTKNKIDYFSEAAVKFVDTIDDYYKHQADYD